jgi:hypothetical protein
MGASGARSKRKGSSFERDIAKFLTDSYNETFIRTSNSGAYTGGKNSFRRKTLDRGRESVFLGDIAPPENWEVVIECKNYKELDFHNIISNDSSRINKWLDEVRFDAETLFHILFFKISRKGTYLAIPVEDLTIILDGFGSSGGVIYPYEGTLYWILPIDRYEKIKNYIKEKSKETQV